MTDNPYLKRALAKLAAASSHNMPEGSVLPPEDKPYLPAWHGKSGAKRARMRSRDLSRRGLDGTMR